MGELSFLEKLKRRKYWRYPFVDKKLQFNLAMLLAIIGLFNVLYFGVLFYFYSQHWFGLIGELIPPYALSHTFIMTEYVLLRNTIIFGGAFEVVMILLLGLFFSHRIAGPLYAMSNRLKEIARGAIPQQVKLRKDDLLMNFADRLNEAIAALTEQRAEIEKALEQARSGHVNEVRALLEKVITPKTDTIQ